MRRAKWPIGLTTDDGPLRSLKDKIMKARLMTVLACALLAGLLSACATRDLEVNGHKVNAKEVQNSFLAALNYYYATVKTTQQYVDNK